MYANHSHLPRGARAGSFGAALAVNVALVLGIIYAAPKVFPPDDIPVLPIRSIPLAPPPDPIETPATPEVETQQPVQREIFTPPAIVPTPAENSLATTAIEPPVLPPIQLPRASPTGTAIEPAPPALPPLIPAEADPRYARDLQPDYPPAERRAGNEGSVVVRVQIGTDGRVKAVEKVRATSDAFYEVTRRQALTRWRFRPATRGDVPQESWQTLTVRFELDR